MTHVSPDSDQGSGSLQQTRSASSHGGVWYFVLTIFSAGFLAAIPFWHAAGRLRRRAVRRLAVIYTAIDVALAVLLAVTPEPHPDGSSGNSAISAIGGLSIFAVVIVACLQLRGLRREVYAAPQTLPVATDPVVARALAGRQRREESRRMWVTDPALARDLGVGRPDLGRGFDDGGLVDLNAAQPPLIARVCGIDVALAEAVVAAREARGGTYFNLGEVFVDVPLPADVQAVLTERALL